MADLEADFDGVVVAPKVQRTRLTTEEISDAEAAIRHVGDRKLAKVACHYLALESRVKAKGISLDQAVAVAESHYRLETKSISVLNAYNEFLENKPFSSAQALSSTSPVRASRTGPTATPVCRGHAC